MTLTRPGRTFGELATEEFAPVKQYLAPWLEDETITLLVGPKGSGKSWVAMGVAQALASGSRLGRWHTINKTRVLYVEAEMPSRIISARLNQLDASADTQALGGDITVLSCDDFKERCVPNLSDPDNHQFWADMMFNYNVVIFDNLLNCARRLSGKDDEEAMWKRVAGFLKPLRAKGKAFVIVHHTGKSGSQLGTSIKENDVDNIIILTPEQNRKTAGFGCDVRFDKARALEYPDNAPFYLDYSPNEAGRYLWTESSQGERLRRKISELKFKGMSEREIAEFLGISFVVVKQSLRGGGND